MATGASRSSESDRLLLGESLRGGDLDLESEGDLGLLGGGDLESEGDLRLGGDLESEGDLRRGGDLESEGDLALRRGGDLESEGDLLRRGGDREGDRDLPLGDLPTGLGGDLVNDLERESTLRLGGDRVRDLPRRGPSRAEDGGGAPRGGETE